MQDERVRLVREMESLDAPVMYIHPPFPEEAVHEVKEESAMVTDFESASVADTTAPSLSVSERCVNEQSDIESMAEEEMEKRGEERVVVVDGVMETDVMVSVPDVADAREWVKEEAVKEKES